MVFKQQEKTNKQTKPNQTKLLTGAFDERGCLRKVSPLLSSRFIFIAIFRQVSPFLPPLPSSLSPVPSPTATPGELDWRSFHAGAQTFYFQRKPASEGDGRQAGAAQGSRRPAGSTPAPAPTPAPARVELAGRTEAPGDAAAAAPGHNVAKCSRPAAEDEEALRCRRPGNGCRDWPPPAALSSRGPSDRAEGRAPRERRRSRLAAPPPALRLCAALSRAPRNPRALERPGPPRPPPARAVSRHGNATPDAERKSERAGAGKEAARPRRSNARSEGAPSRAGGLSASIRTPGSGPQLERRARNLKTLCSPGFPQPSPSPCESWGPPCPPAPSARWVFFLVFL